jgi:dTMP kinase
MVAASIWKRSRAPTPGRAAACARTELLLDCPVARLSRGHDRFHAEVEAFHERVQRGFHAQAASEPETWRIIDATQSEVQVQAEVLAAIRSCIAQS